VSTISSLPTSNLNHLWAGLLVEELARHDITRFFVAPGSRSTPLVAAVARHDAARAAALHYDERGTAFAALGYGRSAGAPAGWITTSGTAVPNGLPAAVEAATDGVPMLFLTADRPPEKRATGANQTIKQPGIFGEYVRWQFDLPAPTTEIAPEMVLTTAARAAGAARRAPPGPVHLNCMFRKPLEPADDGRNYAIYLAGLDDWRAGHAPYTRRPTSAPMPAPSELGDVADALAGLERGLVVCGRLDSTAEARAARRVARALGWPLLPDVTSRLRLAGGGPAVPFFDQVLACSDFREANRPEAVLHLGGRSVSKRLRLFLRKHRPAPYVVARPDPRRLDPNHRVTAHVEAGAGAFAEALAERLPPAPAPSAWLRRWQRAGAAAAEALDGFFGASNALSEPLVARLVSQHLPGSSALVLGSSMPVRDANRYAAARKEASADALPPVFANRGASGIDGTVATAAGVCEGLSEKGAAPPERPVTLLLGDLALLHDLNSLALLRERPVTVVALNNGGGGIFHFLPVAEHADVFEPHFTTPHDRSFEKIAATFGLPYEQPTTPAAFAEAYRSRSGEEALIEVRTDRADNRALHDELEEHVAQAVK
jgi:2-succinyl-5-enolpyruvyl-6-hydroxy-3-cyclohexene-1-carboxylate synthase